MKFSSNTAKLSKSLTTNSKMMADFIDVSVEQQELLLNAQIENARINTVKRLEPKEACYNCDEPLVYEPSKLFCDKDCAEDYEKYPRGA